MPECYSLYDQGKQKKHSFKLCAIKQRFCDQVKLLLEPTEKKERYWPFLSFESLQAHAELRRKAVRTRKPNLQGRRSAVTSWSRGEALKNLGGVG